MNYLYYYDKIKGKYNIKTGRRNIFIIGTPNHGNIGDQAIWYATQKVVEDYFEDSNVVDIDIGDFWENIGAVVKLIQEQDIIVLNGGGNFGNYYMDDEMIRRCVITYFPNNKLIMFPQTIFFSKDENGRMEMKKSMRIYGNHKNLFLIARDTHSYKVMKDNFMNKVFVLPDVVLALNFVDKDKQREGVLFCFRSDAEGIMDSEAVREMEEWLSQRGEKVKYTDTQVENYVKEERESLLINKIREFQTAKIVVTDRLHGMIFSVITGTPCIVFDNFNSKIKNAYWDLKDLDYVKMVSNSQEFVAVYELLSKKGTVSYSEKFTVEQFKRTFEEIMRLPSVQGEQKEIFDQDLVETFGSWSLKVMTLQEQIRERVDELAVYKDWVNNLQRQNEELSNTLYTMREKERRRKIHPGELYKRLKSRRKKRKIEIRW